MSEKTIPRYDLYDGGTFDGGPSLRSDPDGAWMKYEDVAPLLESSEDSRRKTQDNDRLREIQARVEKATDGPWALQGSMNDIVSLPHFVEGENAAVVAEMFGTLEEMQADGEFIAHAREDIPYLLAEIARLRSSLPQGQEP